MATTTTATVPVPNGSKSYASAAGIRKRRIPPQAGRALEILGHSIEYLIDESVHSGANIEMKRAQTESIRLLMALNREIYFECPEIPSFRGRLARVVRPLFAWIRVVRVKRCESGEVAARSSS